MNRYKLWTNSNFAIQLAKEITINVNNPINKGDTIEFKSIEVYNYGEKTTTKIDCRFIVISVTHCIDIHGHSETVLEVKGNKEDAAKFIKDQLGLNTTI